MAAIKIWLDDMRQAPEGWINLKNIEGVEKVAEIMLQKEDLFIESMDFDFHLNHTKLGDDVMKYLADLCVQNKTRRFWPKTVLYHSTDMNGNKIMKAFADKFVKEVFPTLPVL